MFMHLTQALIKIYLQLRYYSFISPHCQPPHGQYFRSIITSQPTVITLTKTFGNIIRRHRMNPHQIGLSDNRLAGFWCQHAHYSQPPTKNEPRGASKDILSHPSTRNPSIGNGNEAVMRALLQGTRFCLAGRNWSELFHTAILGPKLIFSVSFHLSLLSSCKKGSTMVLCLRLYFRWLNVKNVASIYWNMV